MRPLRAGWLFLAPLLVAMSPAPEDWTVLDGEGRPLAHGRVVVHGRPGGVRTDADGRFALTPLPTPPFQLVIFDESGAFRGTIVVEQPPGTPEARILRLVEESVAVAPEEGIAPETPAPPASAASR
ncbi:MAG TPA: carboxypeptidase-like regulatory domain-containing protein, partial [Candidatus Polarisedimenticolaceae bacterium]|nr:carboxypeptidase-like regulatory domain-containing protein [Candidatus Polarisedimenticolaceae bacterium]